MCRSLRRRPSTLAWLLALFLATGLLAAAPAMAASQEDGAAADDAVEADDGGEEADEESWSVAEPPASWGEWTSIAIDTTETTWSNVDVSPDGGEIVFDMLGDVYTVPIDGGDAVALTEGIDWSFQPRYSPDGSRIAFVSDRSGGDNLWVMAADGSGARQVSDERENLVHNPAWSPDGRYLAAKKGYTSTRSIPAGEIWMFHVHGSGHEGTATAPGLQLVERPDGPQGQKNIAEPAFSADGAYLYYSQDTTPGVVWQYDKDSSGQIFETQRLELATGEVEAIAGGAGGAIRPTPSPDGRTLAFVKRLPTMKSALYLKDLESGREWPVYEELDRDLQETNGSHGNAPAFAWMPEGDGLVFWAGGKIRRLDLATGRDRVVPVRIRTERKVKEALRVPVEVAPETVAVKSLRWLTRSPDGRSAAFQALGRIWVVDLATGSRHRLTSQEDHVELYPSFSRDGRSIVYATWDDQELGSIRTAPVGGGAGRVISSRPGHYVQPTLSPDGATVVYVEVGGGYLLSPVWGAETGLFALALEDDGREPVRLAPSGLEPHFGAQSDRVYFARYGEGANLSLHSIDLQGHEEREVAAGPDVASYRVSPDGRWLGFVEQWKAYAVPFTPAGKSLAVGSGQGAIPLRQLAARAGGNLHWSGEDERLALGWSHGPHLYERPLAEAFAFLPGAPEKLPEPLAQGHDLSFEVPASRARGTVALVGAKIVTMRDAESVEEVIERGTVVVEGDRIAAVGPVDEVTVPAGAFVVDASGKTIVPGLVDVHWHGAFARDGITPEQNWILASSLAFGVTTVHDPSNDTADTFAAAELQRASDYMAPRIYSTGRILYGAHATGAYSSIQSLEDARFHVERLKDVGAISVKSYNQPRRDQRQQVLAAARELGLMVVPEGGAKFQHNMTMVVDGHTGIEHALPIATVYDDVLQLWAGTDVGYTPTFVVAYGGLAGENYWYQHTEVWKNERLMRYVPRHVVLPRAVRSIRAPEEHYNHVEVARGAKELRDRGVGVHIGAHGQREGLGAHWEMWMMEQGGFTPWEALRGATIDGARYIGLDGDIGSIEPGKLADLVVIDGDPLADLRRSEMVELTMVGGRLYETATMDRIGPEPQQRERFYFEDDGASFMPESTASWLETTRERLGWSHGH